MARTGICPTCGNRVPIKDGMLRCPNCLNRAGTLAELWIDLRTKGKLTKEGEGNETMARLRHLMRERFGGFDDKALGRLYDYLICTHGMSREEVEVAKRSRVVELLTSTTARETIVFPFQTVSAAKAPARTRTAKKTRKASTTAKWLTVSQAAQISGANKGMISRAVDANELKGKGRGRNRRICPADLARWQLDRATRPERVENPETVRKRLRNALD
jgi:hypothetical protein